jgi:hypothetical protein
MVMKGAAGEKGEEEEQEEEMGVALTTASGWRKPARW